MRNNSQVIRNELHELRNEAQVIKNNSQVLRNKAHVPRDNDKTKTKTKDEVNATLDKINNKIDSINKINKRLSEVNTKVTNKVKSIYEAMCELQNEIYNDPWLRLVELNKIEDILDDALNVVSKEIYGKNRISSKIINIDKHKGINGYVSKLTDVINNKINLINKIGETIDHVMCEINNEINMIDEKIHKASEMDNETLYLIDDKLDKLDKFITQKIKITLKNKTEHKDKTIPKTKTKTVDKDKAIPKTKDKHKAKAKVNIKINNTINLINKTYITLKKAKTEITNKIKTVDKEMRELKGDLWSRAVKLNEIDAILDDAINVA